MIELLNISKHFAHLPALTSVSLKIEPAKVHALLGENGAGKTTLMNILFGLTPPTSGQILIHNSPAQIRSPRQATSLGIGMVHQHFKLIPPMTLLENLALAMHSSAQSIQPLAQQTMQRLAWNLPLHSRIEDLDVGSQQRVEIVKALMMMERAPSSPTRLLILDEPTAVLAPHEVTELFTAIRHLRNSGVAILFISHKLAEVQYIADTVTILRKGKLIFTGPNSELTPDQMAEKMVGSKIELPTLLRQDTPPTTATPTLQIQNLSSPHLHNISLQIRPGEILGIAGVDGNGQSELVQTLLGTRPATSGTLSIANQPATHRLTPWRIQRIAYIPEDRHRDALLLSLSLRDNLMLKTYRKPPFSTLGFLRYKQWRAHAAQLVQRFDIRAPSIEDRIAKLSGGNQQKAVLARELEQNKKPLVIAVNPTRGLDVGATAFVMNQLLLARQNNAAILLIHSDLDELLALSDRLLVMYNGTLTESNWPNDTKENIGKLMMGIPAKGIAS